MVFAVTGLMVVAVPLLITSEASAKAGQPHPDPSNLPVPQATQLATVSVGKTTAEVSWYVTTDSGHYTADSSLVNLSLTSACSFGVATSYDAGDPVANCTSDLSSDNVSIAPAQTGDLSFSVTLAPSTEYTFTVAEWSDTQYAVIGEGWNLAEAHPFDSQPSLNFTTQSSGGPPPPPPPPPTQPTTPLGGLAGVAVLGAMVAVVALILSPMLREGRRDR